MHPSIVRLCALAWLGLCAATALGQTVPGGGQATAAGGRVRPAQAAEMIEPGVMSHATSPMTGERIFYEGSEPEGIFSDEFSPSCGPFGCLLGGRCGPGCEPINPCCCNGMYVRAEYLLWGTKGADLPALVTTSPNGTPQDNAGVLGVDGTQILFGGEGVNSNVRSGGRVTLGWWLEPCRRLGIEADYFSLQDRTERFRQSSSGDPILARPFYDVVTGEENSSLTAFPNLTSGQIAAYAQTRFQGAGVRGVYNLCCGNGTGISCITCCPVPTGYRFDAILGYRFLRLDDRVGVTEQDTSLDSDSPGSFLIRDLFQSENQFHGVDLGTSWSWCKGCFSLDLLGKVALGNTRSKINIAGSTIITENEQSQTFTGGILAQRTNIGNRQFDEFAVVPELGITAGYQINPCWRATVGYTFIYWSRVARAGDQIDRQINPDLFPPEQQTVTTHLQPAFNISYTDFWAQGLTLGLEGSW